jgi:hypothetical protein
MTQRARSPLIPPQALDVRSSDESESNISPDSIGDDDEADSHKIVRLKRNKMKKGRRNRAIERKEAWAKYRTDLDEYHKKKDEREAEDRYMASKTYNDHYNKIQELAQELEAISHPNEEQRRLQEALQAAARQTQGGQGHPRHPARTFSHRNGSQDQRRSAFDRLGPDANHNEGSRTNHHQNNRTKQPRERGNRPLAPTAPQSLSYSSNWREGGGESDFRETRIPDRFPCFSNRLLSIRLPHKFKPSNHSKYDGKSEPRQWLCIYSL